MMNDDFDLATSWLAASKTVVHTNKGWADKAIAQLSDDQLHVALDDQTNCVAVIMKHVAGNLRSRWTDFLTADGEKSWRQRDDEFVDTFAARAESLADWESGWSCLLNTLESLQPEELSRAVLIRGEAHSVPLAIQRSITHCCYHVGQIVMIARILAGEKWTTITIPRGASQHYNQQVWGKGHYQK